MTERVVTTLTLNYRKQWGINEAIREIGQNTLDELERLPRFDYEKKTLIISDNGHGMTKRQFLLLGISEKSGEDKRGQYGEGLKIALVVLLRKGYKVTVKSQDWKCNMTTSLLEGEEVVTYDFDENDYTTGVQFRITGLKEKILRKIVDGLFLPENPSDCILNTNCGKILSGDYAGKMYSRRIFVNEEKKAIYGYDLYKVELGTDRQYASHWSVRGWIGILLSRVQDHDEIERIIRAFERDTLEAQANNLKLNDEFVTVLKKMHGDNVVIGDANTDRGKVSYNGGELVRFTNSAIRGAFEEVGIESAGTFLRRKTLEREKMSKKTFDDLGKKKKRVVKRAFKLVSKLGLFTSTFESMMATGDLLFYKSTDGTEGRQKGTMIILDIGILNDLGKTAQTIVHELIHLEYNYGDLTDGFQSMMDTAQERMLNLVLKYMSLKSLDI